MLALRTVSRSFHISQLVRAGLVSQCLPISRAPTKLAWRRFSTEELHDEVHKPISQVQHSQHGNQSNSYTRQQSKALRINNLPTQTTLEELKSLMSQFGEVSDILMRPASADANFRRAAVTFTTLGGIKNLMDTHNNQKRLSLHGTELFIRYGSLTRLNEPCKQVFIGNLSSDQTAEDVRELVKPFMEPKSIRLNRRGFAHLECFSVDDASALIEAHEAWPLRDKTGRLLRMNYDLQKEPWNVLCVSSFAGSSEKLGEVFANYGCADGVEKVTAYQNADADLKRPPLYFIHCTDIATATKIKETLQGLPKELEFHVDYGNPPKHKPANMKHGHANKRRTTRNRW